MRSAFPESTHEQVMEHLSACAWFIFLNVTTPHPSHGFSKDKISFFGWTLFFRAMGLLLRHFLGSSQCLFLLPSDCVMSSTSCLFSCWDSYREGAKHPRERLWGQRIKKSPGTKFIFTPLWKKKHMAFPLKSSPSTTTDVTLPVL